MNVKQSGGNIVTTSAPSPTTNLTYSEVIDHILKVKNEMVFINFLTI